MSQASWYALFEDEHSDVHRDQISCQEDIVYLSLTQEKILSLDEIEELNIQTKLESQIKIWNWQSPNSLLNTSQTWVFYLDKHNKKGVQAILIFLQSQIKN